MDLFIIAFTGEEIHKKILAMAHIDLTREIDWSLVLLCLPVVNCFE